MTTEQRLARLERDNWIMRGALAVVIIVTGLLAMWRARPGTETSTTLEEIRARRFAVVDAAGKVRGTFGVTEVGPKLELNDRQGETRARLSVRDVGPELWLRGIPPKGGSLFLTADDEGARIEVLERLERCRIRLEHSEFDGSHISFWDKGGGHRALLVFDDTRGPEALRAGMYFYDRRYRCQYAIPPEKTESGAASAPTKR